MAPIAVRADVSDSHNIDPRDEAFVDSHFTKPHYGLPPFASSAADDARDAIKPRDIIAALVMSAVVALLALAFAIALGAVMFGWPKAELAAGRFAAAALASVPVSRP